MKYTILVYEGDTDFGARPTERKRTRTGALTARTRRP